MPSDLPGFPGASQIYHVGATGFFLDYSTAIKLSTEQQAALNGIKGKSMGDLGAVQRRIDQAEGRYPIHVRAASKRIIRRLTNEG